MHGREPEHFTFLERQASQLQLALSASNHICGLSRDTYAFDDRVNGVVVGPAIFTAVFQRDDNEDGGIKAREKAQQYFEGGGLAMV